MAEAVQEKSRGLKFAEQLLLSQGWEHGKGLGRAENGISEAIKVKVKCDKGGIGHREGEQFSFHWWDHVFNKASSSLQVETDQNGITLKRTAEEEEGAISNKKPRKALQNKSGLYGCFVKSATLLSGQEEPEPKAKSSGDSSSDEDEEEEEQKLDLSSTTKLSDADLMRVCGGRTAHKGARHGLTMSAKLARLEQQEAEFLAKYGKKTQTGSSNAVCVTATRATEETIEASQRKKKKKEKKSTESRGDANSDEVRESPETDPQRKKKKKKREEISEAAEDLILVENIDENRSKKRKNAEEQKEDGEEAVELHSDCNRKKKKKKKKKSVHLDAEHAEFIKSDSGTQEEAEVTVTTEKQKKKKCKLSVEKSVDEEELPLKKKKKKKSKER